MSLGLNGDEIAVLVADGVITVPDPEAQND
jgi:hypothetical protein